MDLYYFIQKNGTKQGPFKLSELNLQTIYSDELIWRSDNDQWKKASEFEELHDILINKPPLTPTEERNKSFNNNFLRKFLPFACGIYFFISLLLSVTSFIISTNDWNEEISKYLIKEDFRQGNYLDDTVYLNNYGNMLKSLRLHKIQLEDYVYVDRKDKKNLRFKKNAEDDSIFLIQKLCHEIMGLEAESSYRAYHGFSNFSGGYQLRGESKYKIPQNVILTEHAYGSNQSFLFRTLKAFFSKIYLTKEEQDNSILLFFNLTLSSFVSLFLA